MIGGGGGIGYLTTKLWGGLWRERPKLCVGTSLGEELKLVDRPNAKIGHK